MRKLRQAFTLLELIVVIVILGLLAAMVVPTFKNIIDTSKLEITEVSAASFARQTVALAGLDTPKYGGKIMQEHALLTAADMPMNTSLPTQGNQAAELPTDGRMVVFGNWEFSGNTNTLSVKLADDGARMGVAISVPDVGCAFALADGNTVTSWNVKGVDVTNCTGSGAFVDEEELKQYGPPPTPLGLRFSFGVCSPGVEGWMIEWDENVYVDIFVNGVYQGIGKAKDLCIPGKKTDVVTVVTRPNNPADASLPEYSSTVPPAPRPDGVGAIGDTLDNKVIEIPEEEEEKENPFNPENPPVTEITVKEKEIVLITWPSPSVPSEEIRFIVIRDGATQLVGKPGKPGEQYVHDVDVPAGNHSYVVRPVNKDGKPVGPDVSGSATIVKPPTAVASGSQTGLTINGDTVNLVWGEVPNTPTAPLTGYRVYKAATATGPWSEATVTATNTFQDKGLSNGQYCYTVASYGLGGESERSQPVCATINLKPTAPQNLQATPGLVSASLTWSPVKGAETYRVYNSITGLSVAAAVSTNSVDVPNLTPGTSYTYYVIAVNKAGMSPRSEDITFTTKQGVTYTGSWNIIVPEGVTQMKVTLQGSNGNKGSSVSSGGQGASFSFDLNVTPGETLQYVTGPGVIANLSGGSNSDRLEMVQGVPSGYGGNGAGLYRNKEVIAIAGGGGGAGAQNAIYGIATNSTYKGPKYNGGDAGLPGEKAGDGYTEAPDSTAKNGQGASPTGPGVTAGYPAAAGVGNKGGTAPWYVSTSRGGGGGGGGGYFGGSAGIPYSQHGTGGGGGSSYISPTLTTGVFEPTDRAGATTARIILEY